MNNQKIMKFNRRYYLWDFSEGYGWQQTGRIDGYATMSELTDDHFNQYTLNGDRPWKILRAEVIKASLNPKH
jgi:hypothetical protein